MPLCEPTTTALFPPANLGIVHNFAPGNSPAFPRSRVLGEGVPLKIKNHSPTTSSKTAPGDLSSCPHKRNHSASPLTSTAPPSLGLTVHPLPYGYLPSTQQQHLPPYPFRQPTLPLMLNRTHDIPFEPFYASADTRNRDLSTRWPELQPFDAMVSFGRIALHCLDFS